MGAAPLGFWITVAFAMGAIIGSFLNVVIWRLPRGKNLSVPGSHCPKCNTPIPAWLNIPLISFLVLGGKCKTCKVPISPRYFCVELLTGVIFAILTRHFGQTMESAAYCLFFAALIAAFFIDLELFIIPDQLNTFAFFVGFTLDLYRWNGGVAQHSPIFGFLPQSVVGGFICAGVFVFIQFLGRGLFKKEAMGDGDVKLARAIGAILPLASALISFFLAIAIGAVTGLAIMLIATRKKGSSKEAQSNEAEEIFDSELSPWWTGFVYLLYLDMLLQFASFCRIPLAKRWLKIWEGDVPQEEIEEDWTPGPTHIPFGPYMVVGALIATFYGQRLLDAYLVWSHIKA